MTETSPTNVTVAITNGGTTENAFNDAPSTVIFTTGYTTKPSTFEVTSLEITTIQSSTAYDDTTESKYTTEKAIEELKEITSKAVTTTEATASKVTTTSDATSAKVTTTKSQTIPKVATTTEATTPKVITTTEATTPKLTTPAPTGCDPITVEIDGNYHHFPSTLFGLVVASNVTCDNGKLFSFSLKTILIFRMNYYMVNQYFFQH